MRKKITNKKITASITLDRKLLEMVDSNFSNRSKFIESIIIEELTKNSEFEQILKKMKIIL